MPFVHASVPGFCHDGRSQLVCRAVGHCVGHTGAMGDVRSIGPLIRRLRTERGWSQERLAERVNDVSGRPTNTRHEVYRWETGKRVPRTWLPHLAEVFDVPQERLEQATAADSSGAASGAVVSGAVLWPGLPGEARAGVHVSNPASDVSNRPETLVRPLPSSEALAMGRLLSPAGFEMSR